MVVVVVVEVVEVREMVEGVREKRVRRRRKSIYRSGAIVVPSRHPSHWPIEHSQQQRSADCAERHEHPPGKMREFESRRARSQLVGSDSTKR